MGWSDFFSGEKYDGDSGKVSNVDVNVKVDKGGHVTDILVNEGRGNSRANHDHYYEKSSGWWGSHHKGK